MGHNAAGILPVGDLPPAKRLRIEAVRTYFSRPLGTRFIGYVGGTSEGLPLSLSALSM